MSPRARAAFVALIAALALAAARPAVASRELKQTCWAGNGCANVGINWVVKCGNTNTGNIGDVNNKFLVDCSKVQTPGVQQCRATPTETKDGVTTPAHLTCKLGLSDEYTLYDESIVTSSPDGANVLLTIPSGLGVVAAGGQVLVKGGDGYCQYDAWKNQALSSPANCGKPGEGTNQCGLSHIDFCLAPCGSDLFFDPSTIADEDTKACGSTTLKTVTAKNLCGEAVSVTRTVTGDDNAVINVPEDGTFVTKNHCGANTVTYTATTGMVTKTLTYKVNVAVDTVTSNSSDKPMCSKSFKTDCMTEPVSLIPTANLDGCSLTAVYAEQSDFCGKKYDLSETVQVGVCRSET
jgi:hypothetical protein